METRTSNVVTLSFSTPMGEILVTLPGNFWSLNDSTVDARGLAEVDLADIALVHFAFDVDLATGRRRS